MPQTLVVGTIAGVLVCLLLAGFYGARRRALVGPERFNAWQGVPAIASIPRSNCDDPLLPADDLALQGVRSLATAIDLMTLGQQPVTVALTATAEGTEAGFVAANLAAVAAAAGEKVLLADATTRGEHRRFGVAAAPGIAEVLSGASELAPALHHPVPGIAFLPRGESADALDSDALAALWTQAAPDFSWIVVATPAANDADAAAAIARQCSVTLMVGASRRHSQATLDAALGAMSARKAVADGLVFAGEVMRASDYEAEAQ